MSSIIMSVLAHNLTQPHEVQGRPGSSFSTATPFPFPPEPQWGPDDIGTLVFGCVASILGIFTLWAAFWLPRRRTLRAVENGA